MGLWQEVPHECHVFLSERIAFEGIATFMQSWAVCQGDCQVTDLIWGAFNYSAYSICLRFNLILEVLGSGQNANLRVGSAQWPPLSLWGVFSSCHMATATPLSMELFKPVKPTSCGTGFSLPCFCLHWRVTQQLLWMFLKLWSPVRTEFFSCCLNLLDSKHDSCCSTFPAGVGYSSAITLFFLELLSCV